MPADIAACTHTFCELRLRCARYRMVVGEHQTYGDFQPESVTKIEGKPPEMTFVVTWNCAGYVPVNPKPWPLRPENECV